MTVLLPVTGHAAATEPAAGEPGRGAGAVVLLVEDEAAVREATRRILTRGGYSVLAVATGHDAIARAGQPGQIDVLITDVTLPKMQGKELADRIRVLRPGVRVLFMSGHIQDLLRTQGVLGPGFNLVEKPFSTATLLAKLTEVLA